MKLSKKKKRIDILILAAGKSERMRGQNKLLKKLNNKTLIEHVVSQAIKSKASDISIIIQENNIEIENLINLLPIKLLKKNFPQMGIGYSISKGVELIKKNDPDGILILLGDMPDINSYYLDLMIDKFINNSCQKIIRACTENFIPGNPVIFPKILFNSLMKLRGDTGAKRLLEYYKDKINYIKLPKMVALNDLDTEEQFKNWKKNNAIF